LIDHGREVAAGTPAQLKAQVGEQRVDVIATDSAALDERRGASTARSPPERRRLAAIDTTVEDNDLGAMSFAPPSRLSTRRNRIEGVAWHR
jgi:hypothetical protein